MPPSRIPEAQVQAILAELRANEAAPELPLEAAAAVTAPPRSRHTAGFAAAVVASALVLGLAFSPLPDRIWNRTQAPRDVAPAPVTPQPAPETPVAPPIQQAALAVPAPPTPAQKTNAVRTPARRSTAATRTVARASVSKPAPARAAPARPRSRCLAGGPCGRTDVNLAERRLRAAYASAEKAGVSRMELAYAKTRWDAQRRRYSQSPRTSVRTLRAVTAELNRKTAAARSDR